MRLQDQEVTLNVFQSMKFPIVANECYRVDVVSICVKDKFLEELPTDPLEAAFLLQCVMEKLEFLECSNFLEASPPTFVLGLVMNC